jgi:hypothetical protein
MKPKPNHAEQFKDPSRLADFLSGLVDAWQKRDNNVYCLATAGRNHAEENSTEEGVFAVIEEQLGYTDIYHQIKDGIEQLSKMNGGNRG